MANRFRKSIEEIDKIEKGAKKRRIEIQCHCPHRSKDGDLQLVTVEDKQNHAITAYRCDQCYAIIAKKTPTADDVDESINTLLIALEYMKIAINPRSEKDTEDINVLGDMMENLISLRSGYRKTLERNAKRNKERNDRRTRRSTVIIDD